MITDAELIFWIVAGIIGLIATGVLWFLAKRESENCIEWIADGGWK